MAIGGGRGRCWHGDGFTASVAELSGVRSFIEVLERGEKISNSLLRLSERVAAHNDACDAQHHFRFFLKPPLVSVFA